MKSYKLSQINIFPIKSLQGISVDRAVVEERGLQYDRRWMLVDQNNLFISQRTTTKLTAIKVNISHNGLVLNNIDKKLEELTISFNDLPKSKLNVRVWKDVCNATKYNNQINEWFSEAIDLKCKLIYMPEASNRKTSLKYYNKSKNVSFADGYPFLIIGEESLNLLNSKLKNRISMDRFRSNFVFSGGHYHDEDNWYNIKIGDLKFTIVKSCARCTITTINPSTGEKSKEPLSTLSTYRKINNKILFGQNLVGHSNGIVKIGDKIIVEK